MRQKRIQVKGLTIDAEHSQDLDDAVWVEQLSDGWLIDISVADVASEVKINSPLDQTARSKKETVYLRDFNKPMLPRKLSEGFLSLLPGEQRKVITTKIKLNSFFEIGDVTIVKANLKSEAKLSHQAVDSIIFSPYEKFYDQIKLQQMVSQGLYDSRRAKGACALYDIQSRLYADEDGIIRKYDDMFFHAQMIVQEMMIAANEAQARWIAQKGLPFIYRNHEANTGIPSRQDVIGQVNQALLHPEMLQSLRDRMNLWMKKAEYGIELRGHYGLNLAAYAHTTSPIRRYVDIVNQRIVKAAIQDFDIPYKGYDLVEIATEINKWRLENEAQKNEAMKEKTNNQRRAQLKTVDFSTLTAEMFTKLLKRVIKDNADSSDFKAELVSRIDAGTVGAFDAYYILFEAGIDWFDIQNHVLTTLLIKNPHLSISVLEVARARRGFDYTFHNETGADGRFYSWPIVKYDSLTTTVLDATGDSTKKGANSRAATKWLERWWKKELDDGNDAKFNAPKALVNAAFSPPEQNYVGMLQEYCQQMKLTLPEFNFEQSGSPHMPIFKCKAKMIVKGKPLEVYTTANNKKDAKQFACRELYGEIV